MIKSPVATPADIDYLKEKHQLVDEWPVVCEPFIQWVIEDNFVNGRPPLEKGKHPTKCILQGQISRWNFAVTKATSHALSPRRHSAIPQRATRHYLEDGRVEIDNNQIENKIRPLALARKNYMFAGSNKGAQRAAMMYSFFASCKEHDVNPRDWLKDVLKRIGSHKVNQLEELLLGAWVKNRGGDL